MGSVGSTFNSERFADRLDQYIGGGYGISELFSRPELNYMLKII